MTQLDRDTHAVVEFFVWDPWSMFRALHAHVSDCHGQCMDRCGLWPCMNYSLASYAEQVYRDRLAHRIPAPREATP